MRTAFTFDDDKELFQLARKYSDAGSRVASKDVANKMRRTGHSALALRQRLNTLMRTWGRDLSRFPPSFFAQVRRPLAVTRQLRGAAPDAASNSASVETIVHAIFEHVPRVVVTRDCNTPHCNVGEILPQGITKLLDELRKIGPIDERNVFLDIGAGLGNIVVHVALATAVQKAIGIELREDVYQLGLQMIGENVHSRLRSRLLMTCGDVAEAKLSRRLPYEQATIVYWNNVLFEPHVIEIVKEHLSYMSDIRFFISTVQICPRHREPCFSGFCSLFELLKEVALPCSWKAGAQKVFIYRSKLS
ncbi:Histone methylation protein [Phytophthora palmivora]|uniref:Histone-lysine N-methyltransferase, H3 lysine-79 specific n=1 Tax=Phytophthora palmivora TaxID=4796 RepID=A0A2P4YJI2_9STRA|nr:Histone methylation protein [Phytophthora palmivora]